MKNKKVNEYACKIDLPFRLIGPTLCAFLLLNSYIVGLFLSDVVYYLNVLTIQSRGYFASINNYDRVFKLSHLFWL